MNKMLFIIFLILTFFQFSFSQEEEWEVFNLSNLPVPLAHNTIVEARVTNQNFVYSFSGVKDSLHPSNICDTIFKYNVLSDSWSSLNFNYDSLKTVGRKAVFTNNRIYLFGGYYFDGTNQLNDERTLIFNPFQDTLELSGANMPNPVQGQVTAVWRDSLIFNIGGLLDNGNFSTKVQLYDPFFNSWEEAEELPNNDFFKSQGAGGYILEDTIYLLGGISGDFVPSAKDYIRKGVINPDDPLDIDWSFESSDPSAESFGANCSGFADKIFLFGGSFVGHDFYLNDTIDSLDVIPRSQFFNYFVRLEEISTQNVDQPYNAVYGIAKMGGGNWITTGGVDTSGVITSRTLLLSNKDFSSISEAVQPPVFDVIDGNDYFIVQTENTGNISVYDLSGRLVLESFKGLSDLYISKSDLVNGMLLFVYEDGTNLPVVRKKILVK